MMSIYSRSDDDTLQLHKEWHALDREVQAKRQVERLETSQQDAFTKFAAMIATGAPFTEAQLAYMLKLLRRLLAPDEPVELAQKQEHPDVRTLHAFLMRGAGKVTFFAEGRYVRAKYTGAAYTKYPGCFHVTVPKMELYLGRIDTKGAFLASQVCPAQYLQALYAINDAPDKAAAAYGHAIGACAFCGRELTDEPSVHAGYGPTCASKYGLPWGDIGAQEELPTFGPNGVDLDSLVL